MKKNLFIILLLIASFSFGQSISSFSPKSGPGGTSVTITGSGFDATASNNVVYLDNMKCSVTAASTNSLTITIPYGGMSGKFKYTNKANAKVCQSGQIFVMAYSNFPAANSYNCNYFNLKTWSQVVAANSNYTGDSTGDIVITDIDEDGKSDVVTTNHIEQYFAASNTWNYTTKLISRKNNTTGVGPVSLSNFSNDNLLATYSSSAVEASFFPAWIYAADFNGSGKIDYMLHANGHVNNNRLVRNVGSNTHSSSNFSVAAQAGVQNTVYTHGDFLDMNRNGTLDFIGHYLSTPWAQNDYFYLDSNNSSGTSLALAVGPLFKATTEKVAWSIVKTIDFDNDGDDDVILVSRSASDNTFANTRVYIAKNNGANTITTSNFTVQFLADLGAFGSNGINDLQFADFDNDGLTDIVMTFNNNGLIKILKNTTSGSTVAVSNSIDLISGGTSNRSLSIVDFGNDGKSDILFSSSNGFKYFKNTSSTSISFDTNFVSLAPSVSNLSNLKVVDFNLDGTPEVVGKSNSSDLVVYNYLTPPTLNVVASLVPFKQCIGVNTTTLGTQGIVSGTQTFKVSGTNLTANVTVASVSGFEYSVNGTTFTSTLSLTPTAGVLNETTIYVRVAASASGAFTGNISVTSTTCGTPTQTIPVSRSVTATMSALPVLSPSSYCLNSGTPTLSITVTGTDANNVSYQWYRNSTTSNTTGQLISGATSSSYEVPVNTGNASASYYYCKVSANCGEITSNVRQVSVSAYEAIQVIKQPVQPIIPACYVANLLDTPHQAYVTATNVSSFQIQRSSNGTSWTTITLNSTLSADGNKFTFPIPANIPGTMYYRVKMNPKCTASSIVYSNVLTMTTVSSVAGTINATSTSVCKYDNALLNLTGSSGSIQWQRSTNGTTWGNITGETSTQLDVPVSVNTSFRARVNNGSCGIVYTDVVAIQVISPLGTISSISGPSSVTTETTVTYSVANVLNALNYIWDLPAGMSVVTSTGNQISVYVDGSFVGGLVTVKAVNDCAETVLRTKSVAVQGPVALTITGESLICMSEAPVVNTYSVSTVEGATVYNWTLPVGAEIISFPNTNSVQIRFTSTFRGGAIAVSATNLFATLGTSTINVGGLAQPSVITGASTVCGSSTATYSVSPVSGATSYAWTLPTGMSFVGDSTGNSINVSITGNVEGNVSVKAIGTCGSSVARNLNVSSVVRPGTISGPRIVCGYTSNAVDTSGNVSTNLNSTLTYTISPVQGAISYTWTAPVGVTILSGQGTNSIQVSIDYSLFQPGNLSVIANYATCGSSGPRTLGLQASTSFITGPTNICGLTTATYSVPSNIGTNFVWNVPSWMTIVSGTGTSSIVVEFANACSGDAISLGYSSTCNAEVSLQKIIGCSLYSKVIPSQCESTLPAVNSFIFAVNIPQATQYKFIVNDGIQDYEFVTTNRYFRLTDLGISINFNVSYNVKVGVFVNGSWLIPLCGCYVSTPGLPVTQLTTAYCNSTLSYVNSVIQADQVSQVTQYKFEVAFGGNIYELTTTNRWFRLTDVVGLPIQYATSYSVRVAVFKGNSWGSYGTSCLVTTPGIPSTNISNPVCGTSLAYINSVIQANSVIGASTYKFKVIGVGVELDYITSNNWFRLTDLPGVTISPSSTYNVSVAVQQGQVWSSFGDICKISTPSSTARQVESKLDVSELVSTELDIVVYPNPYQEYFTIALGSKSSEKVNIEIYNSAGVLVYNNELDGYKLENLRIGEHFSTGLYFLKVKSQNFEKSIRIIKQ